MSTKTYYTVSLHSSEAVKEEDMEESLQYQLGVTSDDGQRPRPRLEEHLPSFTGPGAQGGGPLSHSVGLMVLHVWVQIPPLVGAGKSSGKIISVDTHFTHPVRVRGKAGTAQTEASFKFHQMEMKNRQCQEWN
ncbi:hypothetical protein J6590_043230 [Homalodisca vitripennis]|nr:hypothetical protein J6590_043230 [Homalodisca vitripennis]